MFKVTESEIHIFAKELNTIIIIDRESFLESYFTLIEIDEPINDVRKFIVLKNMLIIIFNLLILKIEPC